MATFNVNITKKPASIYNNTRAIAFFNVLKGKYNYDNDPSMVLKKIKPEVLLRDIIVNDDNTLILSSNTTVVTDNSDILPLNKATIQNPNLLSNVVFKFKSSLFESDTISPTSGTVPSDLIQINGQSLNLSVNNPNPVHYNIGDLHNLFVKNYDADKFLIGATRGYVDLLYNFTIDNGPVDPDDYNWSILRIQFGFPRPSDSEAITLRFNQITLIKESDFNNEIVTNKVYGLPYLKGTDANGELIGLHKYGEYAPLDNRAGIVIDNNDRVHRSGSGNNVINFHVDIDIYNKYQYNFLNPENDKQFNSCIDDLTYTGKNMFDVLETTGRIVNFFGSHSEYDIYISWHAFAIINDTDYIPLT